MDGRGDRDPGTVFIVDDDDLVLGMLGTMLEGSGYRIRLYSSARAFLAALGPPDPRAVACVIVDLHMPDMSGLELQEQLVAGGFKLPLIVVTAGGDVASAVQAMKAGAKDFLEKPIGQQQIVERVGQAMEAQRRLAGAASLLAQLSPREREVVELVVAGKANKQIALAMKISAKTVELHRGAAMRKLRARHVSDLVATWLMVHGKREV